MPKKRKLKRRSSLLTILLIFFGILFILTPLIYYTNQTIQLAYFAPKVPEAKVTTIPTRPTKPVEIRIKRFGLKLPIEETYITNRNWGVSTKGASHLATSARPTEQSFILLYSHNTRKRFSTIRWLKNGDLIELNTQDEKTYGYKVYRTQETTADDIDILSGLTEETLVLYTCSGFADLKRYFVFAKPI